MNALRLSIRSLRVFLKGNQATLSTRVQRDNIKDIKLKINIIGGFLKIVYNKF